MIEGTGPMKAMKESAMKKMHASPTKAMSPKKAMKDPMKKMHDGAMKAMKAPMKKMEGAMKAMDGAMKAMSPKKAMDESPKKAMSPKKKLDSPETQAKIKKMIISGIEKNISDREIRDNVDDMSDGSLDYNWNRKNKTVTIKKGGSTGFEGLDENDPDKE